MIRILHTIDTTGPGGAETVFINLIKGLDPAQFQSFAAIRGPGWVCNTLRKNGIDPLFIPSRGGFNIRYLLELVKIIYRYKIDIVQSHLLGSNVYCSLAGMICRVLVVSTFHGFVDSSDEDRLMLLKSRIINYGSGKIVFVSERLREYYLREFGFSPSKSITIYNGVDTSFFRPQKDDSIRKELGLDPKKILIGAVGNIRTAKGYDIFLRAARLIHEKQPECRFIIVGEGSGALYESLLKLRKELGLEKVFFFLGFREDTGRVYNNLDIFISSSVSEGFSISTIEAMACGIPIVVTRSGGPDEIIRDYKNGIIVNNNEMEIANAVISIVDNIGMKRDASIYTCDVILNKFNMSRMIEMYQNCYKQFL
jgi:glycosyltransferase involved in cell wall biosynthesis